MIPRANITAWRAQAPWPLDSQVEQDLILSRALAEIYSHPKLIDGLAFRGGTALHKLFFQSPGRYSEDLDFVQMKPGPIGSLLDELRSVLAFRVDVEPLLRAGTDYNVDAAASLVQERFLVLL